MRGAVGGCSVGPEGGGTNPRKSPDGDVYLVLRPERIQAFREVNEFSGRILMRAGTWVV